MKRRDFLVKTTSGVMAIGAAGCSDDDGNPVAPDTKGDSIPTAKLGTTDVTVSKFAFGSHILREYIGNTAEREYMVRDSVEKGVTTFDIYNAENGYYQYEPMIKYLGPVLNDVVLSISVLPEEGRTYEDQFFYNLGLFKRDYFDMVRISDARVGNAEWNFGERMFELRDEGYIRAAGVAIHRVADMDAVLQTYGDDLDFICFPYNFYHNKWQSRGSIEDFDLLRQTLSDRGIGIIAIKPLAGDWLVQTLKEAARGINSEVSYSQACLRYILNSDMSPDSIFVGMNHFREFDENIKAFYNPEISEEETVLLNQLRDIAQKTSHLFLPDHYKFLNDWAPKHNINGNNRLA